MGGRRCWGLDRPRVLSDATKHRGDADATRSPIRGTSPVALPFHQPTAQGYLVANIKSQVKRNRQNERRRDRNRATRSEIRTRTKRATDAAAAGADNVDELTRDAIKAIDLAAANGALHKNTAARRKSRLMKQVASAG